MNAQHGLIAYEQPECAQVFFLFAGLGEMLMMNPVAFLQETGLFNRNVVLFKGSEEGSYEQGISKSIDSFEAIVDWQREFLTDRPHLTDVFTAGTSAGGAAALRCGHDLFAQQVWAFGTRVPKQSIIAKLRETIVVLTSAKSPEEAQKRFRSMPQEWKDEFFDCRENLDRNLDYEGLESLVQRLSDSNGVTRFATYYCPRSPVDTFVARALGTVPNMTVERVELPSELEVPEYDTGHNVLRPLQFTGRLQHLFPAFKGTS